MLGDARADGSPPSLSPEARRIVDDEEALLARALDALVAAHANRTRSDDGELRSVEALRALRDEAVTTAEDDLPTILHEMSVRQRLRETRPDETLPDPASPYLAHLQVQELLPDGREDPKGKKHYLLGHRTFLDGPAGVRIVDWRVAPIAQVFYGQREGDDYAIDLPGRTVEGRVVARRVVVIERGVLTQIHAADRVLARDASGAWSEHARAALAPRRGDVTAMLDAEQFAAISVAPERPLLVLGSAGSGKTTVALHRLARLAARDDHHRAGAAMQVIVPEEGLARLSRRLLAPLGAEETRVFTLDAWALSLARAVFERSPKLADETPALVSSLKRHPALHRALSTQFAKLQAKHTTFTRLRRRLRERFTDRAFLEGVVRDAAGDLPSSVIDETIRHTRLQLAEPLSRQLAAITVAEAKQAIDGRAVGESTPDDLAGTIDVDDLPILLFLRAMCAGLRAEPIAHVVLDEAEDFSLFELSVLGALLQARDAEGHGKSVTLAGDEAQQTASSFAGWQASLRALDVAGEQLVTCRLATSYRCPRPVVELARAVLGPLAPPDEPQVAREGAPVGRFHFPDVGQAWLYLGDALRDLVLREPAASIGVVTHDEATARAFHAALSAFTEARLVLAGELTFEPGIDVMDVDGAKGLEFDYVIVPDASADAYPATDDARRRLHVAVTRASQQLWLVSSRMPSPLLAGSPAVA